MSRGATNEDHRRGNGYSGGRPLSHHNLFEATMEADDDDSEVVKHSEMPTPLHWEDKKFRAHTLSSLNKMRKERHFCDVILRIGVHDVVAHRVVLAASSPYFAELFTKEEDAPGRREVEEKGLVYNLEGFSRDALERLVDYAYTSTLDVPGDMLKSVYSAARSLRLDRAANECGRFMMANMTLTSGLEIRSTPMVAAPLSANEDANGHANGDDIQNGRGSPNNGSCSGNDLSPEDEEAASPSQAKRGFNFLQQVDDFIATANVEQLQTNRVFMALPRLCVEVLHAVKEERDAVQARPLSELVLDWAHRKWLDDASCTLDGIVEKQPTMLIMNPSDNSLRDCQEVEEGSAQDSEIIQDYKKNNQHFEKNGGGVRSGTTKVSRRTTTMKPAKPREMLYSRQIKQRPEDTSTVDTDQYHWKVVVAHRLDDKSILGLIVLDSNLVTLSIVQRINTPSSPPSRMTRSCSDNSLPPFVQGAKGSTSGSPTSMLSRPPSMEKGEAYVPITLMKTAKCAVGAGNLDGRLVVCGGYDRGECLNQVEAYDITTNTWNNMPAMLTKRGRFDVTSIGGKAIYAVGGSNGHTEESSAERFILGNEKWSYIPSLPVPLSNIGLGHVDGVVYCVGGSYGSTGSRYCFKLNEETQSWQRMANLTVGRFQAAVAGFQGKLYAVGGCESWNPVNSTEVYDPCTNTWTMGPPLNSPRRGCGLAIRKGKLICVGGSDGTQSLCTTEVLDIADSSWHPGPTMTTCRANVAIAMVNERLFAVGGFNGKSFLNSVEFLDPETDEWTSFLPVEGAKFDPESSEASNGEVAEAEQTEETPEPKPEAEGDKEAGISRTLATENPDDDEASKVDDRDEGATS